MSTQTTIERFLAATTSGAIKAGVAGLSRGTLERLVAAGVAKRATTVGAAWAGSTGTEAPTHRPSCVRYDRA